MRNLYFKTQQKTDTTSDKFNKIVKLLLLTYAKINEYYHKLVRFACLRYADCEHFVSALGPLALDRRESYL